ncbi:MAG: TIGR01777 family oxidoreductase [Candidatus Thiodiazotropha sp.]
MNTIIRDAEIVMKIALTGASGFVGSHLSIALKRQGHQIVALSRFDFNQSVSHLTRQLQGCDAVINLAGEPINRRWTEQYKRAMVSSRVETTRMLVRAMEDLEIRPKTFISTSAIGAFDDQGRYTEADPPNAEDFLGRLAKDWEQAAREAEPLGIRTLIFRLALVLGPDGGLLKQLLIPFRMGVGGPIGDGQQAFSWIHVDDLVDAYLFALKESRLEGVFHLSAPKPVTNGIFSRLLGRVLHRPALIRIPFTMLKLMFGEAAGVMISGQWVVSKRLPESGFQFRFPELEMALENLVRRA